METVLHLNLFPYVESSNGKQNVIDMLTQTYIITFRNLYI